MNGNVLVRVYDCARVQLRVRTGLLCDIARMRSYSIQTSTGYTDIYTDMTYHL